MPFATRDARPRSSSRRAHPLPFEAPSTMIKLENFVGGRSVPAGGKDVRRIVDPADGETVVAELRDSTDEDVASAVAVARRAFVDWRAMPVVKRCRILFHCKEL